MSTKQSLLATMNNQKLVKKIRKSMKEVKKQMKVILEQIENVQKEEHLNLGIELINGNIEELETMRTNSQNAIIFDELFSDELRGIDFYEQELSQIKYDNEKTSQQLNGVFLPPMYDDEEMKRMEEFVNIYVDQIEPIHEGYVKAYEELENSMNLIEYMNITPALIM
jgi:hypothetical protein